VSSLILDAVPINPRSSNASGFRSEALLFFSMGVSFFFFCSPLARGVSGSRAASLLPVHVFADFFRRSLGFPLLACGIDRLFSAVVGDLYSL